MAASVIGNALSWGLPADEVSLVTQSVSITNKRDKKEVKDYQGEVASVAYYNATSEVSVEGYGNATANTPGATLTLTATGGIVSTLYIDEVSLDYANEDFVKSSITATAYLNI